MTNISISKNVKAEFKKFKRENESIDEALLRLFDEANVKTYEYNDGNTSIVFTRENLDRLRSFRAYQGESYSSIMLRLLESVK